MLPFHVAEGTDGLVDAVGEVLFEPLEVWVVWVSRGWSWSRGRSSEPWLTVELWVVLDEGFQVEAISFQQGGVVLSGLHW